VGDTKYTTKGILSKKKGKTNTTVITELPISMWTDRFKESVEELVESKDMKAYKNYSTDVEINFELDEHKDGMTCTLENLKLMTHLSTNNMVLFSEKGAIKKYDRVDIILEEFCRVRYSYYIKRKAHLLENVQYQLTLLQNKRRFLKEVMDGSLVLQEIDEDDLRKEMVKRKYYQNHNNHNDSDEDSGGLKVYGYLVNMNIRSFTKQKVETLEKEIEKLEKHLEMLSMTTESMMWLSDLHEFQTEYERVYQ
jgi:DNA topoisomerase-2